MELPEELEQIHAKMTGLSLEQALERKLVTPEEATVYRRFWMSIIMRRDLKPEGLQEIEERHFFLQGSADCVFF
jgi:hypothetical protein